MSTLFRSYFFRSDSRPDKLYQTLEYENGQTSCDCPGWTRRNPPGGRTCKHTRLVSAGLAANAGSGTVRIVHHTIKAAQEGEPFVADLYDPDVRAAMAKPLAKAKPAAKSTFGELGKRKFAAV